MDRKCNKCLMVIPTNATVCGHCRANATINPLTEAYCVHCNTIIVNRIGHGNTCVGCGASKEESNKAHGEKMKPYLVIGGGLFVLLYAIALFSKN
jgi:hypothetical protein